jgi:hypothetical protein
MHPMRWSRTGSSSQQHWSCSRMQHKGGVSHPSVARTPADTSVSASRGLGVPSTCSHAHGRSPRLDPFLARFYEVIDEDCDEGARGAIGGRRGTR